MDEQYAMDLLRKFVAFHTENGNEKVVADAIQEIFDEAGVSSKVLPLKQDTSRANLVAEVGHGSPVLALTGHMDTVSAQQDGWKTNPFEVVEEDGMLYGRGVTDMKAGLAAMVITMLKLKKIEGQLQGTVRLLATAGEEVGMPGAEELQEQGYMKDVESMIIGEPSGYTMVYATKGELNLSVEMKGKSAHSSTPELGVNAVEGLLEFLGSVTGKVKGEAEKYSNPDLGGTVFNIDVIKGGSQVNTIPERASAQINIRVIPEFDNKAILKIFDDEVEQFNASHKGTVSYDIGMDIVPVIGAKNSKVNDIVRAVAQDELKAQGKTGQDAQIPLIGVSGGTDASKLLVDRPLGEPCIMFGPGNATMHCVNESLPKHMYFEYIDMYEKIAKQYMGVQQ